MEELLLRQAAETPTGTHPEDHFYGDQELQIDLHNGEVEVVFPDGEWILAILVSLTAGIEGSGNYLIFYHDRIVFVADGHQLGAEQYVEIRPEPELYRFIPNLAADLKSTSRIILRTKFSNIKTTLAQARPTKTRKLSVKIHKKRVISDISVSTGQEGVFSSPHTIACGVVSHPPIPEDVRDIKATWTGAILELNAALSDVLASKAADVYTYIKMNGSGIYFYAYHATAGHGSRGKLGNVSDDEFKPEEKNIKLIPLSSQFFVYKLSRRGLKTLQKLNAEQPSQVELKCVSDTTIAVTCSILDENNTHTYYFM